MNTGVGFVTSGSISSRVFCGFVYGKRFSYGLQWVVGAAERLGGFKVLRYPEIPIHSFDYLLRGPRSGTNLRRP